MGLPMEIVESVPVNMDELLSARSAAMAARGSAAQGERLQLQGAGTPVVAPPSTGAARLAKSNSQNDVDKDDGARGGLTRVAAHESDSSSCDGEVRRCLREARSETAGVQRGPRAGGVSHEPAIRGCGPTLDSPRRKRKKDTRRGSEWLKPRRAKSSRWTKRRKPRANAWPIGPEPTGDLRCHKQTQRDEASWALQSIEQSESDDEQLSPAAAAAASSAVPASPGRTRRKFVQHTSSPAEPADEHELEFGSPLLPDAVRTGVAREAPHPLRCGQLYDNMRRLHQHATGEVHQRRIDPPTSGASCQEGSSSDCDDDSNGGRYFEGKVLVHSLRKYSCKNNDTVVTVCRKLGIQNVSEVFEINRRRLADIPNFKPSAKLRQGHVLLVTDENAELKTTVQIWKGWDKKDGKTWVEYWSGEDEDGLQHDLEAEDIYTGVGFDVRGATPGHQIIGQRIRGTSGFLVVAYQPAADHGPSEGPALWKVHYENQQGEPTGVREDLELHELEEKYRANGARLSICDAQLPPSQRTRGAVVTERSPEVSGRQHENSKIELPAPKAPAEGHATPQLDDESTGCSPGDSEVVVDRSRDIGAGTSAAVLCSNHVSNQDGQQRFFDWKDDWIDKWRSASFPVSQRRTSRSYQDPDARANLWENMSTRSFMVVGKLRELARRGGLPQSSHDELRAAADRCKCGCKVQKLDLKEKALQDVNMSKLIDTELRKQWFCGEVCSTSRCGDKIDVRPRLRTSCESRVAEFVHPPRCGGGRNGSEKRQLNRRKASGVNPAFISAAGIVHGGVQYEDRRGGSHKEDDRTGPQTDEDQPILSTSAAAPRWEADPKTQASDLQGKVLRRQQQESDDRHVAVEVHTFCADDDYDTQGFEQEDGDTSVDELAQPIDESSMSESEGGGGVLESGARSTPNRIDLTTDTNKHGHDTEEQARRAYSKRRRVRTDAFDPYLESCKPQWSPVEKKHTALETVCGDDNVASVDCAAASGSNAELPSQSSSAESSNSDSMDESDQEPPEYVMLELFCGTCIVSQRAKAYWGDRVKRVTLDYNEKLDPERDGSSDHHLTDDVLSPQLDNVRKWVKSLLDKIRKDWGARAISFVWASPDCSQYSKANTAKTFHEKGRGLLQANKLVTRMREIINELQCHAAKLHLPFYYIIENPSSGRLPEQDVLKDLPFVDVSYCHYGHPARKDTRLWFCATPGFLDRLKPRKCAKDSAAGECHHKRQHKTHQCSATGGRGSQRGLQGPLRHRVPSNLVDEILASLFPKKQSLEELLEPLRRVYSDEEIRHAVTPQYSPTPATSELCPANQETGAEASNTGFGATGCSDGTVVI